MADFDPYSTLGLKTDCSTLQARAAFRRLSKTAHPDAGGDAEHFSRISLAHTIITDTERRAFWDKHKWDRGPQSSLDNQALSVLTGLLRQVLMGDSDVTGVDHVRGMTAHLHKEIDQARENLRKLERAVHRIAILQMAFVCRGESQRRAYDQHQGSVISNLLEGQRRDLERARQAAQAQIAERERAIEVLSEYTFQGTGPDIRGTARINMVAPRNGPYTWMGA